MARNSYFQFKQFRVDQDKCGMKVTSDACLFGAMIPVENSTGILDIGAGTGLLSLMAAQRSSAYIDAVELDDNAAEQSLENFKGSPWSERLKLYHCPIQDFSGRQYDTIISNPPFYTNALKAPCAKRSMARHSDSLSLSELLESIDKLMTPSGSAWVLLSIDAAERLQRETDSHTKLFIHQKIALRHSAKHEVNRIILKIGKLDKVLEESLLTFYEAGTTYSEQVKQILEPYYIAP